MYLFKVVSSTHLRLHSTDMHVNKGTCVSSSIGFNFIHTVEKGLGWGSTCCHRRDL